MTKNFKIEKKGDFYKIYTSYESVFRKKKERILKRNELYFAVVALLRRKIYHERVKGNPSCVYRSEHPIRAAAQKATFLSEGCFRKKSNTFIPLFALKMPLF